MQDLEFGKVQEIVKRVTQATTSFLETEDSLLVTFDRLEDVIGSAIIWELESLGFTINYPV